MGKVLYKHTCPYCEREYESIRKSATVCCGSKDCRKKRVNETYYHTEEYREKKREYDRKYRQENKEKIAITKERCRRAKYELYLERVRGNSAKWARENFFESRANEGDLLLNSFARRPTFWCGGF